MSKSQAPTLHIWNTVTIPNNCAKYAYIIPPKQTEYTVNWDMIDAAVIDRIKRDYTGIELEYITLTKAQTLIITRYTDRVKFEKDLANDISQALMRQDCMAYNREYAEMGMVFGKKGLKDFKKLMSLIDE